MFQSRRITTMGGDKFRDEHSLAFDGTNDYVTLGNNLNLGTGDFSFAFWVKVNDDFNLNYFFSKYQQEEDRWYFRANASDPPKLHFYSKTSDTERLSMTGSAGLDDYLGKWVHIAMSVDRGTSVSFYINGQLDVTHTGVTQTNSDSLDNTGGFHISKYSSTYANQNISELAYYNTALSASQVATIYNGREPYNHKEGIASGNLQAWYRMGDGRLDSFGYNGVIGDETDSLVGTNLVANGDMETSGGTATGGGTAIANWSDQSSPSTRERNSTKAHSGTYSCKFTPSSSSDGIKSDNFTSAAAVYKISFWVYPDDSQNVTWKFLEHDTTAHTGDISDLTQDEWNYVEFYAISSSAGGNASLAIMNSSETSGDWYIDDVSVEKLNGNAGVMTNMGANNFEGDTP